MIKILHYGLSPNRGGIETYLDKLWSNIDKNQFHFDFIDEWDGQVCFKEKFEQMGSAFYNIVPRKKSLKNNRKQLNNIMILNRPDILHCHLNTLSYITPVEIALKYDIPVIVHSRSAGCTMSIITNSLHYLNKLRLLNKDLTRISVSTEAGKWLFGNSEEFTTINNGVNISKFIYSASQNKKIRKELGILPSSFVLGNVGSLIKVKNQMFLLEIFEEIKRKCSDAMLIIAGEGNMHSMLLRKINDMGISKSVFLLGNRSDIPAILCAMDVFIMPSLFEGFPNAVLEAQTNGLPCVLSDTITKEVNVVDCSYVSINKPAASWADVIMQKGINKQRENAWQIIESAGFSVDNEIKKIEALYKKIME